jgi:hypothetical protein
VYRAHCRGYRGGWIALTLARVLVGIVNPPPPSLRDDPMSQFVFLVRQGVDHIYPRAWTPGIGEEVGHSLAEAGN